MVVVVSFGILALTGTSDTADEEIPIESGEFTKPIHEFAGMPLPLITRPTSNCVNAPFVDRIVGLFVTGEVFVNVLTVDPVSAEFAKPDQLQSIVKSLSAALSAPLLYPV